MRRSTNCRAMGRRSLEATKLRRIWCARAVVTVFRERTWAVVEVFFFAELLGLCVLDDEVDDFFFGVVVDEALLSCASSPLPGTTNCQARRITRRRLEKFTALSLARLPHRAYDGSLSESVPAPPSHFLPATNHLATRSLR